MSGFSQDARRGPLGCLFMINRARRHRWLFPKDWTLSRLSRSILSLYNSPTPFLICITLGLLILIPASLLFLIKTEVSAEQMAQLKRFSSSMKLVLLLQSAPEFIKTDSMSVWLFRMTGGRGQTWQIAIHQKLRSDTINVTYWLESFVLKSPPKIHKHIKANIV